MIGLLLLQGGFGGPPEDVGAQIEDEAESCSPKVAPSVKQASMEAKAKRKLTPQVNSAERKKMPRKLFQDGMFSPSS